MSRRTLGQQAQAFLNSAHLAIVDLRFDGPPSETMTEQRARRAMDRNVDTALRALTAAEIAINYARRAKLQELPKETGAQRDARIKGLDHLQKRALEVQGEVHAALATSYSNLAKVLALVAMKRDSNKEDYVR